MHAGTLLSDWFNATNISKTSFGAYIELSSVRISQILKMEQFSPELALKIHYATGGAVPVQHTCQAVFSFEPFPSYLDHLRERVAPHPQQ